MTHHSLDDILPFVEKPSRYLGSEINTVKKDLKSVKLRFALGFPDLYEIVKEVYGDSSEESLLEEPLVAGSGL